MWNSRSDHVNLNFVGSLQEAPDMFGDCWTSFMIL